MNLKNNSKGITLIALVITIIVLLILAGVTLNLVSGGDGILGRAEKAVTETTIAEAKERAEMLVAEYKTDFYDAKYVKKDYDGEIKDYAKTSIGTGKTAGDYFVTVDANDKVVVYKGAEANEDFKIVTGTLLENSTIVWDEVEQGNGGNQTPDEVVPETTKYTVSYEANGGTGSVPASEEYEENASVTVDFDTVPTKEGYTFLGWAETTDATTATYTSDGTTSFTMGKANITLYAVWEEETSVATFSSQIDTDNYGDYVNLGTSYVKGNELGTDENKETATEDWRIFHKDSNGVYLILADYLPYSYETSAVAGSSTGLGTGLLNTGSSDPYDWHSNTDRTDLISRLDDTTTWSKLLSPTYTAKGITVKGAFDVKTWVESWNKKGDTELFTESTTDTETYNAEGWLVGDTNPPTEYYYDLSSDTGYGNTLYFPYQEEVSNNWGYWLASPSAYHTSSVVSVNYRGVCGNNYDSSDFGVRPVVYIPSDIKAEKVGDVWELDI